MPLFRPALIVVDLQEDFCPPAGSLAVPGGRDVASVANELLKIPFALKIATQDWHPKDHISFAVNHDGAKPFESSHTCPNPENEQETETITLWPVHCVKDTKGAELIPELNTTQLTHRVKKGTNRHIEMYSAFRDTYLNPSVAKSNLGTILTEHMISHVYIAGLAMDFCVKHTAIHAAADGYVTYIIHEACRPIDASEVAMQKLRTEFDTKNVKIIYMNGPEISEVAANSKQG